MAEDDTYGGSLTNKIAWQSFLIPYFKEDTDKIAKYKKAYGFNDEQLDYFIKYMRKFVQTRMFGGAYKKLTLYQALMGYKNDVAAKINGGNYIMGDDFSLLNVTTPIVNDQMGFQSNSSFGLYTGSKG